MGRIAYTRNTTYTITYTYQVNGVNATTGQTLMFTVKPSPGYDTDSTDTTNSLIKKDVSMSGNPTNTITINPTDIADTVLPGTYYYDIKILDQSGAIYLGDSGQFILTATATNRET